MIVPDSFFFALCCFIFCNLYQTSIQSLYIITGLYDIALTAVYRKVVPKQSFSLLGVTSDGVICMFTRMEEETHQYYYIDS